VAKLSDTCVPTIPRQFEQFLPTVQSGEQYVRAKTYVPRLIIGTVSSYHHSKFFRKFGNEEKMHCYEMETKCKVHQKIPQCEISGP
jgi:hypothetical protein